MAPTLKSLTALEKSKEAVSVIKERLIPVLQHLTDDSFGNATGRAQASVALSVGMMRYMSARIRGLDHGRKVDDPLRKDLNNMKRILAKLTKKSSKTTTTTTNIKRTTPSKSEGKTKEEKDKNIVETPNEKEEVSAKKLDPVAVQVHKPKVNDKKAQIRSSKRGNTNNNDKRKKSPAKKAKKSPAKKARK